MININNLKPLIYRGISVSLRVLFVIIIPKILLVKDYNDYSLFSSLILFVSSASGLGFPVYFIKKVALNELPKEYYFRFITPISLLSGAFMFIVFSFILPIELTTYHFIILLSITIFEIYINEFLRIYQSESNLSDHLLISFVKSFLLIIIFSLFYLIDRNASLYKILLSWLFSNLLTIIYLNPDYRKILNFKSKELVFTWPIIFFSFFYFIGYLCDRFVLYYDKILFYKHFDERTLISLNLLVLVNQSSFNLIESTFLLKKYNQIFNNKLLLLKKEVIDLLMVVVVFSLIISFFMPIFYNQYFVELKTALNIFFSSILYFLIAILSWYYNLKNYSYFSPKSFLILSFFASFLYITLTYINIYFINSIFITPILYPLSYFLIHKTARFVLLL